MATTLADILFAAIAVAIAVAQAFILRSTARGMAVRLRHPSAPPRAALEWAYAIAPAVALIVLLMFAWTAMHPAALRVEGTAPAVGVRG